MTNYVRITTENVTLAVPICCGILYSYNMLDDELTAVFSISNSQCIEKQKTKERMLVVWLWELRRNFVPLYCIVALLTCMPQVGHDLHNLWWKSSLLLTCHSDLVAMFTCWVLRLPMGSIPNSRCFLPVATEDKNAFVLMISCMLKEPWTVWNQPSALHYSMFHL